MGIRLTTPPSRRCATAVRGGLAWLVAAITAAEVGARVMLYEAHHDLGGRARTLGRPLHLAKQR